MIPNEGVGVNALLQVNATILVGIFVFISLFPLGIGGMTGNINSGLEEMVVNIDRRDLQLAKDSDSVKQILVREKGELESFVRQNNTPAVKQIGTAVLQIYEDAIKTIDDLREMGTQQIKGISELGNLLKKTQERASSAFVYWIVGGLSIPFGFSIMVSVVQFRTRYGSSLGLAKWSTWVGIAILMFTLLGISYQNIFASMNLQDQIEGKIRELDNLNIKFSNESSELNQALNVIHKIRNISAAG